MSVLVIYKGASVSELAEDLSKLRNKFSGSDFKVIVSGIDFNTRLARTEVFCTADSVEDKIKVIESIDFKEVVLIGYKRNDILPISLISSLLSKDISTIRLYINNLLARYQPFYGKNPTTVVVFPGQILPLNMGSHQRVFNLVAALNYSGFYTDLLITGGNRAQVLKSARLLMSISTGVYLYKNNKKKMPKLLIYRRMIERFFRKKMGLSGEVPELFADRLSNKATFSLQKTLKRLAFEKNYKNIVISYAWLSKAFDQFSDLEKSNFKWICDTHDVQYIRNESANKHGKRFFALNKFDIKAEKTVLDKYDSILAISDSDYDELSKDFSDKVIKVSSSFDYAFREIKTHSEHKPLHFGFIGGKMDANVKSLEYVINEWWPAIRQFSPDSKMIIAGSICGVEAIEEITLFDDSIERLGFVDNLSDFYSKIDIALNPALVQGGLNFKSVEAVVFGKILITNKLGAKCLGQSNIATVINSEKELVSALHKFEISPNEFYRTRKINQKLALDYFGETKAYNDLKVLLDA